MTTKRRVILDTGVVVSALILPRSVPRQAFHAAISNSQVLVSHETISELDDVLRRPRFNRYLSEAERLEFLAAYVQSTESIEISVQVRVCRDPKDDKFLALAGAGAATAIVSGDSDLLALHPFRFDPLGLVEILSPRDFLHWVQGPPGPLASPAS